MPYSFSDTPKLLGAPQGFAMMLRAAELWTGAGFVVIYIGDTPAMPGLSRPPPPSILSSFPLVKSPDYLKGTEASIVFVLPVDELCTRGGRLDFSLCRACADSAMQALNQNIQLAGIIIPNRGDKFTSFPQIWARF